jgi:hypothetical protein
MNSMWEHTAITLVEYRLDSGGQRNSYDDVSDHLAILNVASCTYNSYAASHFLAETALDEDEVNRRFESLAGSTRPIRLHARI